jgi:hypothetical protein
MKGDLDNEMKAMLLRYWQSRPASERFETTVELSAEAYYRKHPDAELPPGWHNAKLKVLPFPQPEDDPE